MSAQGTYRFYSVKRQTILLVNGEPIGRERVNNVKNCPQLGAYVRGRLEDSGPAAERRKNEVRDCAFPILRDIFSSFCRPERSNRPVV